MTTRYVVHDETGRLLGKYIRKAVAHKWAIAYDKARLSEQGEHMIIDNTRCSIHYTVDMGSVSDVYGEDAPWPIVKAIVHCYLQYCFPKATIEGHRDGRIGAYHGNNELPKVSQLVKDALIDLWHGNVFTVALEHYRKPVTFGVVESQIAETEHDANKAPVAYRFGDKAQNVSETTQGYYQGWEVVCRAQLALCWQLWGPESFKEPIYGAGLRSPSGEIFRDGLPGNSLTEAFRLGGFTLLEETAAL